MNVHRGAATFLFSLTLLLFSCSAPKEEIKEVIVDKPTQTTPVPDTDTEVYRYNDRYFVKDASIDLSTNIDDPLQALRVIQLMPGHNQVLVISSFREDEESDAGERTETWFGLEMPSFEQGSYRLADASKVMFYQFYLGEKRRRLDGESFDGTITITGEKNGSLTGYIEANIKGKTKSFDSPSEPFRLIFSGSFKVKNVPLEATRIGK